MSGNENPPSRLPAWLDRLLRWWWWVYLSFGVLTVLTDLIQTVEQQGPTAVTQYFDKYSFMAYLARMIPIPFWTTFGIVTTVALAGLSLNIFDWLESRRTPADLQRASYLKSVNDDEFYKTLPLVVNASVHDKVPDLVYQSLTFQYDPLGNQGPVTTGEQRSIRDTDDIPISRPPRSLVILGAPGSGKTTLLKHSMRKAAQRAIESNNRFLPIFISLPQFAPFVSSSAGTAVADYLRQNEPALTSLPHYADELQESLLSKGKVILYLDGLDEVAPGYRPKVIAWINGLRIHPQGAIVIGTRFTDYARSDFTSQAFAEWAAQPMNEPTQSHLAHDLVPILYRQLPEDQKRQQQAPDGSTFVTQLHKSPSGALAFWSGNPLLFTLAAYVYVHDDRHLPTSRAALYSRSIHALLSKGVHSEMERYPDSRKEGVYSDMSLVLSEATFRIFELTDVEQEKYSLW